MRVFNVIRRAAPTFGKEMLQDAAEDQARQQMGFKGTIYTGLPTRGGMAYSFMKEVFGSGSPQEKLHLAGELQSQGISQAGATSLTAGEHPKQEADLANVMRMLRSSGDGGFSVPAGPAAGEPVPVGEVFTAAMVNDAGKAEE